MNSATKIKIVYGPKITSYAIVGAPYDKYGIIYPKAEICWGLSGFGGSWGLGLPLERAGDLVSRLYVELYLP